MELALEKINVSSIDNATFEQLQQAINMVEKALENISEKTVTPLNYDELKKEISGK